MPLMLLFLILPELFTIAFIVLDVHLFREWYTWKDTYDHDYAMRSLYGAIALAVYSLFGKAPVSLFVSKFRKGEDQPDMQRSQQTEELRRPDGTVIHIEFMGDPNLPTILFVHGWNENSTAWYYQKKHFSQTNRVILIDLPGLAVQKARIIKIIRCPRWQQTWKRLSSTSI